MLGRLPLIIGFALILLPSMTFASSVPLYFWLAASPLPDCPPDGAYRDECFGAIQVGDWTYIGEWMDGRRSGYGWQVWRDGQQYLGQFRNSQIDGVGVYTYPDGRTFVGRQFGRFLKSDGYWFRPNRQVQYCETSRNLRETKCIGTSASDVASLLRQQFINFSIEKRKDIQSVLQELGYLEDKIDGVWGVNTLLAIASYSAIELESVEFDSTPSDVLKIYNSLTSSSPTATSVNVGLKCRENLSDCSRSEICQMATVVEGGITGWRDDPESEKYVQHAKSLPLECNVVSILSKEEDTLPSNQESHQEILPVASGTGFFVSSEGHIITNDHVIEGCMEVNAYVNGVTLSTKAVARDPANDLALLHSGTVRTKYFPLSDKNPYSLQEVFVAGFPFGNRISSSLKFTQGIISAETGLGNNYSQVQIDAALQPGNSGGPIFDEVGNVVGVAVAKLDMKKIYEEFGVIPENTNFGIKVSLVRNLMETERVQVGPAPRIALTTRQLSELALESTVLLTCWMNMAQVDQFRSRKVLFEQFE